MRFSLALAALVATSNAASIASREAVEPLCRIELAPGDVRTVTEEEKWALRAVR